MVEVDKVEAGVRPDERVFISYASQDLAIANRMCAARESADMRCWIAPRDVQPSESCAAAIVAERGDTDPDVLLA
jgi:hypothetical protein